MFADLLNAKRYVVSFAGGGGAADRVRVAIHENFFASSFLTDDAMVT